MFQTSIEHCSDDHDRWRGCALLRAKRISITSSFGVAAHWQTRGTLEEINGSFILVT